MRRHPLQHDPVFSDPALADRYSREQRNFFRWMHPPILNALRGSGFTGGRILDVGCGPGYHTVGLKKAFPASEVLGIDLSEPILAIARMHCADSGIEEGVQFQSGDALNIPFGDMSFDAAVCVFLVHLVEDPARLFDEIERVVKPGGHLVIIDLRRSRLLSLGEPEMRSAYSLREALTIAGGSTMRPVQGKQTPIWWRLSH